MRSLGDCLSFHNWTTYSAMLVSAGQDWAPVAFDLLTSTRDAHGSVLVSWGWGWLLMENGIGMAQWFGLRRQNGPFTDFGSDKYQEHAN